MGVQASATVRFCSSFHECLLPMGERNIRSQNVGRGKMVRANIEAFWHAGNVWTLCHVHDDLRFVAQLEHHQEVHCCEAHGGIGHLTGEAVRLPCPRPLSGEKLLGGPYPPKGPGSLGELLDDLRDVARDCADGLAHHKGVPGLRCLGLSPEADGPVGAGAPCARTAGLVSRREGPNDLNDLNDRNEWNDLNVSIAR